MEWANRLKGRGGVPENVIAVDGKTVRGSKDSFHQTSPIHPVQTWSVASNNCPGQLKTEDKSNEITAISELPDLLEMKVSDATEVEKGHGRIETRRCEVFAKDIRIDDGNWWKSLQSVIKITATREVAGKTSVEERYYISRLEVTTPFNQYIRNHRGVENSLYWTQDMVFHVDEQRKRVRHAAENFAVIKKIALNLLKKDTGKESLRSKRLKAAWNSDSLLHLLKI